MVNKVDWGTRGLFWQSLVAICLALQTLTSAALAQNSARFVHPGLLATQEQLDRAKAAINADGPNRIKDAYKLLQADPRGAIDYHPSPMSVIEVSSTEKTTGESAIKNDAMAAYINAIQWVMSGDRGRRDKAIEILNAWSAMGQLKKPLKIRAFKTEKGGSLKQGALEASWALPVWLNAAELIRHYGKGAAGWSDRDVQAFDRFAQQLYEESSKAQHRKNNWGATAAMAAMALGVYQNDRARYLDGLEQTKALLGELISPDGEVFELRTRDCGHPQFTLTAFVQAAEIASNQGDISVWMAQTENGTPALARGLEYIATALLKGSPARDCRVRRKQPGFVLNGYASIALREYRRLGVALPQFGEAARTSAEGSSDQFIGWSSVIHGMP